MIERLKAIAGTRPYVSPQDADFVVGKLPLLLAVAEAASDYLGDKYERHQCSFDCERYRKFRAALAALKESKP